MPNTVRQTITCDVAIIGGGIAGLWLLNRLVNDGYNALLFETCLPTGRHACQEQVT